MSGVNRFTLVSPAPATGCCDATPLPPAAPVRPWNPTGLPAVRYRIGTFTSFRRAMLAALAGASPPNPFAGWREGFSGDYQTQFIELWAYLADVLTFYQERIANEAYLPTATRRDSLAGLAALVGYRPAPGAAASTSLAFTLAKGKAVAVPPGFRAGSKAAGGLPPAVFETANALDALADHNAVPLSTVAPTNQFAPLHFYNDLVDRTVGVTFFLDAVSTVFGGAAPSLLKTLRPEPSRGFRRPSRPGAATPFVPPPAPAPVFRTGLRRRDTRRVVLKGTKTGLVVNDHILIVEHQGDAVKERRTLQRLTSVTTDAAAGTTTVSWLEDATAGYESVTLYRFTVTANLFGSNAPNWFGLPPSLNGTVSSVDGPFKATNWDDPGSPWSSIPMPSRTVGSVNVPGDSSNTVYLDSIYKGIPGSTGTGPPSWAVLLAPFQQLIARVSDSVAVGKAAYALSGRVTRLTLDQSLPLIPAGGVFPLRETTVLAGSEPLQIQDNLPLPGTVSGRALVLSGLYTRLRAGQSVILRGKRIDVAAGPDGPPTDSEPATIAEPPDVDTAHGLTTVTLRQPLAGTYQRLGAVLLANVVDATQGETVPDEVLGSGGGGSFQIFTLKKSPLTYLPATDAQGSSSVKSTLRVTVNGLAWEERPTLLDSPPDATVYTTTTDDAGVTTVAFGDGVHGARPPSGTDNIRAHYRKGLGRSGDLTPGAVATPLDSLPGVQAVTNPLPATGGVDPEPVDQIRARAPAAVLTFGRAVSLGDHASLALSYPGVAKASAAWVVHDPAAARAVAHPYVRLTLATSDLVPLGDQPAFAMSLRSFLDQRRDTNVPLRLGDFTPVPVELKATIDVDDRFPREATLNQALRALGGVPGGAPGLLSFDRLGFGQTLALGAVYASLLAVPGVRNAVVTTFRRLDLDTDPQTVRDAIRLRPTELAVLGTDPAAPVRGGLNLTRRLGGYADL